MLNKYSLSYVLLRSVKGEGGGFTLTGYIKKIKVTEMLVTDISLPKENGQNGNFYLPKKGGLIIFHEKVLIEPKETEGGIDPPPTLPF